MARFHRTSTDASLPVSLKPHCILPELRIPLQTSAAKSSIFLAGGRRLHPRFDRSRGEVFLDAHKENEHHRMNVGAGFSPPVRAKRENASGAGAQSPAASRPVGASPRDERRGGLQPACSREARKRNKGRIPIPIAFSAFGRTGRLKPAPTDSTRRHQPARGLNLLLRLGSGLEHPHLYAGFLQHGHG